MLAKMLEAGSDAPFVHYAYAMELRSRDDLPAALAAFGRVRDRFPDYVPTYLMAAQVAESMGDPDTAREWVEAGLPRAEAAGDSRAVGELGALLEGL